jgi:hypothetical protein
VCRDGSSFTVRDGAVFYHGPDDATDRGTYWPPDACDRLLAVFRECAAQSDKFRSMDLRLASELEAAMREADAYEIEPESQAA